MGTTYHCSDVTSSWHVSLPPSQLLPEGRLTRLPDFRAVPPERPGVPRQEEAAVPVPGGGGTAPGTRQPAAAQGARAGGSTEQEGGDEELVSSSEITYLDTSTHHETI